MKTKQNLYSFLYILFFLLYLLPVQMTKGNIIRIKSNEGKHQRVYCKRFVTNKMGNTIVTTDDGNKNILKML